MHMIANPVGMWSTAMLVLEQSTQCLARNEIACRLPKLQAELNSLRALQDIEQIEAVNSWVNAHPYVSDQVNWHVDDYWATLPEFIEHGGDCEDYAIAKYSLLRALGHRASDMHIVIVNDAALHSVHAVLSLAWHSATLILDNQSAKVIAGLSTPRYQPLMAVNESGLWQVPQLPTLLAGLNIENSVVPASGRGGTPRHEH